MRREVLTRDSQKENCSLVLQLLFLAILNKVARVVVIKQLHLAPSKKCPTCCCTHFNEVLIGRKGETSKKPKYLAFEKDSISVFCCPQRIFFLGY